MDDRFTRRTLMGGIAAAPMLQGQASQRTIKVLLLHNFTPEELHQIQAAVPNAHLDFTFSRRAERDKLADAEVMYSGAIPGKELDFAPKLKWIQSGAAGMEWMDGEFKASQIVTTNMARVFAPAISETALGLLLSLTRRIGTDYVPQFLKHDLQSVGNEKSPDHVELAGKTMGIVGMGGIGSEIARRAYYGFDMHVVATDAKPIPKPNYVEELHDPGWLMEMAQRVDVLVAAVPHTAKTERLFNESVFRSMKKSAYFVAMSRGKVFDDMALVKALKEGWIMGAGLDVFPVEPVPSNHPIFECRNVVMTPHNSGASPDRQTRLVALFAENMRRYAAGLPLVNVVDKGAGY
jgi:phosphoglycerate dehydrogenase-like enzyme